MFELGKKQTLKVVNKAEQGIYLGETKDARDKVLLPIKQCPQGLRPGDEIEVFLYLDSKDRIIATTRTPKLMIGDFALLKVAGVTKIGAFMDWGLEKDLLLPFKQQTGRVNVGDEVLCAMYVDKSGRLCATMKVYEYLKRLDDITLVDKSGDTEAAGNEEALYKVGDEVSGRIYEISENFGAFVAVDDKYSALIPKKEMFGDLKVGKLDKFRIVAITDDGKLTLACRKPAYLQMDDDAKKVLKVIEEFDGVLPFNDKANPEVIKREFGMSKNEFKRAVGRLYKERKIEIGEKSIRII